jgi:hypothetical protein
MTGEEDIGSPKGEEGLCLVILLIPGPHGQIFQSVRISGNYYYYCQSKKIKKLKN